MLWCHDVIMFDPMFDPIMLTPDTSESESERSRDVVCRLETSWRVRHMSLTVDTCLYNLQVREIFTRSLRTCCTSWSLAPRDRHIQERHTSKRERHLRVGLYMCCSVLHVLQQALGLLDLVASCHDAIICTMPWRSCISTSTSTCLSRCET